MGIAIAKEGIKMSADGKSAAAKALERKPRMDAVSRATVIQVIEAHSGLMSRGIGIEMRETIRALPSVQPQTVDWDAMIEEIKAHSKTMMPVIPTDDVLEIINRYRPAT